MTKRLAFACCTLLPTISFASSDIESAAVSIGRSIQWPVNRSEGVTVSNGAVIRVVDQGASLKITGVKLGHAVVKTKTRSLEVSVLPEVSYRSYERLARAIEGRRGLSIDVRSGTLEIRGRLLRASDWSARSAPS